VRLALLEMGGLQFAAVLPTNAMRLVLVAKDDHDGNGTIVSNNSCGNRDKSNMHALNNHLQC
jgi:hypothetical protein